MILSTITLAFSPASGCSPRSKPFTQQQCNIPLKKKTLSPSVQRNPCLLFSAQSTLTPSMLKLAPLSRAPVTQLMREVACRTRLNYARVLCSNYPTGQVEGRETETEHLLLREFARAVIYEEHIPGPPAFTPLNTRWKSCCWGARIAGLEAFGNSLAELGLIEALIFFLYFAKL